MLVHQDLLIDRLYEPSDEIARANQHAAAAMLNSKIAAANSRTQLEMQIELHRAIAKWKRRAPIVVGLLLVFLYWALRP